MLGIWDQRLDGKYLVFLQVRLVDLLVIVVLIRSYVGQSLKFVATFLDVVVERSSLDLRALVACVQVLGMLNGVAPSLLLLVRMT